MKRWLRKQESCVKEIKEMVGEKNQAQLVQQLRNTGDASCADNAYGSWLFSNDTPSDDRGILHGFRVTGTLTMASCNSRALFLKPGCNYGFLKIQCQVSQPQTN